MRIFMLIFSIFFSFIAPAATCKGTITCDDGNKETCEQEFDGLAGQQCRVEDLGDAVQCVVYDQQGNVVGQPYVSICWDAIDIPIEY